MGSKAFVNGKVIEQGKGKVTEQNKGKEKVKASGRPDKAKLTKEEKMAKYMARKAALVTVLTYANVSTDEKVKAAVAILAPRGIVVVKKAKEDAGQKIKLVLGQHNQKNENLIWTELRLGRQELRQLRKAAAKCGVYVNFNLATGDYVLVEKEAYTEL
jgi:hypothetical protein